MMTRWKWSFREGIACLVICKINWWETDGGVSEASVRCQDCTEVFKLRGIESLLDGCTRDEE
jgi:hypothetical protein